MVLTGKVELWAIGSHEANIMLMFELKGVKIRQPTIFTNLVIKTYGTFSLKTICSTIILCYILCMKHEFKIVMEFEDDQSKPLHSGIRVYIDNNIVGCIQDLKFSADTENFLPKLEITFPDLAGLKELSSERECVFIKDVQYHIDNLKVIPGIDIKLKSLDNTSDPICLDEVGTDGHIDHLKV